MIWVLLSELLLHFAMNPRSAALRRLRSHTELWVNLRFIKWYQSDRALYAIRLNRTRAHKPRHTRRCGKFLNNSVLNFNRIPRSKQSMSRHHLTIERCIKRVPIKRFRRAVCNGLILLRFQTMRRTYRGSTPWEIPPCFLCVLISSYSRWQWVYRQVWAAEGRWLLSITSIH